MCVQCIAVGNSGSPSAPELKTPPYYHVQAVARVFDLLDGLASHGPRVGVSELSAHLHMNKTVVQRLLMTMCDLGIVERDEESRKYSLGVRVLELAGAYLQHAPLTQEAQRSVAELSQLTGMTAAIAALDGHEIVYLFCVEGAEAVHASSHIGDRRPLHATAGGKCLLAFSPAPTLEKLLKSMDLVRFAPRTIVDLPALRADLAATRARGYAITREERVRGLCGVAAPILDARGVGVATMTLGIPKSAASPANLARLGEVTVRCSRTLGRKVIGQGFLGSPWLGDTQ